MLVFVDESGDAGFKFSQNSSQFFVMSVVVFSDEARAEGARQRIDTLRNELRLPHIEFHFGKNKDTIRRAFIAAVRKVEFTAFVIVVDKKKLPPGEYKDRDAFYKSVCGIAFNEIKDTLDRAKIIFDDCGGKKFKKSLAASLKRKINRPGKEHISQVGTAESKASNLLQLADYICGVVARTFEEGDSRYQQLMNDRFVVMEWPG